MLALVALVVSGLGLASPVEAAPWQRDSSYIGRSLHMSDMRSDQNDARAGVRSGRLLSLSRVLDKVHARYPGRLLDAQLIQNGQRPIYFIKIMTRGGNLAIITADAATGEVLDYRQGGQ